MRALLLALLVGCTPVEDEPPLGEPASLIPEQVPTDITFFAMGDCQYGGGAEDKNGFHIAALNAFPGTPWREGTPFAGETVAQPLGLLLAGDLTQNGQDGRIEPLDSDEIGSFEADYGLTGSESALSWPMYEGYGNHDFDPDEPGDWSPFEWRAHYDDDPTPAADLVSERNPDRVGLLNSAPGADGHYSWDWGWVHFVQLNLFPGDEPSDAEPNALARDPRDALQFLSEDLEAYVGDSGRPVVLMSHYGFDEFSQEPRWWKDDQRDAFFDAIDGYHVIAYLHGHAHATWIYEHEGLPVYNVGSPYYTAYNADDRGHFSVFRITDEHLVASDVRWSPGAGGLDPEFSGWLDVREL